MKFSKIFRQVNTHRLTELDFLYDATLSIYAHAYAYHMHMHTFWPIRNAGYIADIENVNCELWALSARSWPASSGKALTVDTDSSWSVSTSTLVKQKTYAINYKIFKHLFFPCTDFSESLFWLFTKLWICSSLFHIYNASGKKIIYLPSYLQETKYQLNYLRLISNWWLQYMQRCHSWRIIVIVMHDLIFTAKSPTGWFTWTSWKCNVQNIT